MASASLSPSSFLIGRVAVVTGSSRSIGAAVAQRLADDGASVVVNYANNASAADKVVSAINAKRKNAAIAVKADAGSVEGGKVLIDAAIKTFGRLDILVLNAGLMGVKPLADVDEAFFDQHININVKAPLFITKLAVPHLKEGGRVVFFSSSLTRASNVLPIHLSYVASKGAIEQIARVLSKDLGARGITVNTVSPGPIDTDLFRAGKTEQMVKGIASTHPLNRIGLPEEVAPVVSFLASPAAAWVNGQNILVNGGFAV